MLFIRVIRNIIHSREGPETISIVFTKPEKRAAWEETFNEAKHKLGNVFRIFKFCLIFKFSEN